MRLFLLPIVMLISRTPEKFTTMDEVVAYVTAGDPADKHAQELFASVASIHKSQHYTTFRNAECPRNGGAFTGFGPGERLFVAAPNKPLITCYSWGKESADQRFPIPEQLSTLALADHPASLDAHLKPQFRIPWLLAGGSVSGKLYIWELALGNLVCVKDAHYQQITLMHFSACGTFLVTGALDMRVSVWRVQDLISTDADSAAKPFCTFSDHTLGVNMVHIYLELLASDIRVVSGSMDGTLRVYDLLSKTCILTFVFSGPVACFTRDPAARAFYVGLADGSIRVVSMYTINKYTHMLEAVGSQGKIVTVEADPNSLSTFVHHQLPDAQVSVTTIEVSMDGMSIVSGDSTGRVYVADVVTKQVVKAFTPCKSAIAHIQTDVVSTSVLNAEKVSDKKHRLLAPLKRVLHSTDRHDHTLTMQIAGQLMDSESFGAWLEKKACEELEFRTPAITTQTTAEKELRDKLERVSEAYTLLKANYEDLVADQEG